MVRHYRRVLPAIALSAVLAAAAPAVAKPQPSVPPGTSTTPATTCSETCSGGGYIRAEKTVDTGGVNGPTAASMSTGTYVRAEKAVDTGGANGPTVANVSPGPRSEVVSGHGYVNPTNPAPVVRTVAPTNGFDWGDAAIGAGGALVLILIVAGGALGITSRRRHAAGRAAGHSAA